MAGLLVSLFFKEQKRLGAAKAVHPIKIFSRVPRLA
jgi:hypothetical protein